MLVDIFSRSSVRALTLIVGAFVATSLKAEIKADLVLEHAKIYTSRDDEMVSALAIANGKIIFVGDSENVKTFIGAKTHVRDLNGAVILPGLIDTHIHPLDIIEMDVCDLKSQSWTLEQISKIVRGCVAHYHLKPGQWLSVYQWNNTGGNQPSDKLRTIRAALDAGAPVNPVTLLGNDGHHGAYNSVALKGARNRKGEIVGLSSNTLDSEFADFKTLIGVDDNGEPDGIVNENARYLFDNTALMDNSLGEVLKNPEKVVKKVNAAGITAMMDAYVTPESSHVYEKLRDRNHLSIWTNLALYFDPFIYSNEHGEVQFQKMVDQAKALRLKFEHDPLIKADTVKVFADGVLEGNPYSIPPTLPDSPSKVDYLQPIFKIENQLPSVVGYVDTDSAQCVDARVRLIWTHSKVQIAKFIEQYGYHPAQCKLAKGQFQDPPDVQMQLVREFHQAGFSVHIHAISDAAVSLAIDAIESARESDGNYQTRDGLAHVQLAEPSDIERMGKDHLFLAYTYAWMVADPEYDLTLIPFIQHVYGQRYQDLHPPGNRYDQMIYPVKSSLNAGVIITGGSDAPVETRDPRPFVNMARAVSRRLPNSQLQLTPEQSIRFSDALKSYTISAAKALGREAEIGSLDVGKSADFIVIDRDPFMLERIGKLAAIEGTKVSETWFKGKMVYRRIKATKSTTLK